MGNPSLFKIIMKYSILTIGDEICIGQIINGNAAEIASVMTSIGYSSYMYSIVPDDRELITDEIKSLLLKSDVLIMTGGLGPTHDDITKSVLCDFFEDDLVLHQDTLQHLQKWFKSRNRNMSEMNKAQALIPSKSTALRNRVGTAPGILFSHDGKYILAMPGVPAEMKDILVNEFVPLAIKFFNENSGNVQIYRTIKTSGIFESDLAELIGSPDSFPDGVKLAFLPSAGTVRLRIGANAGSKSEAEKLIDEMNQLIIDKAGQYIFGYDNDSLQQFVGHILRTKSKSLAVAESCTGGLLGALITEVPGSSEYFTGGVISYSNEMKMKLLNVDKSTLETFGAVSEQTACEMALGVRMKCNTDIGISITGVAGPDGGTENKPVGTVFIAYSDEEKTYAVKCHFGKDRNMNRERAAVKALEILRKELS